MTARASPGAAARRTGAPGQWCEDAVVLPPVRPDVRSRSEFLTRRRRSSMCAARARHCGGRYGTRRLHGLGLAPIRRRPGRLRLSPQRPAQRQEIEQARRHDRAHLRTARPPILQRKIHRGRMVRAEGADSSAFARHQCRPVEATQQRGKPIHQKSLKKRGLAPSLRGACPRFLRDSKGRRAVRSKDQGHRRGSILPFTAYDRPEIRNAQYSGVPRALPARRVTSQRAEIPRGRAVEGPARRGQPDRRARRQPHKERTGVAQERGTIRSRGGINRRSVKSLTVPRSRSRAGRDPFLEKMAENPQGNHLLAREGQSAVKPSVNSGLAAIRRSQNGIAMSSVSSGSGPRPDLRTMSDERRSASMTGGGIPVERLKLRSIRRSPPVQRTLRR